jgi:hypothetical protein
MNLSDLTDRFSAEALAKLFRPEPERSQSEALLGSLALLGAGALVGATVALFLAPKPGAQLRTEVGDQIRSTGEKIADAVGAASPGEP